MKSRRLAVLAGSLVLFFAVTTTVFAEYDRTKVVAVMRANMSALPRLNSAANASRFMEAAGQLLTISSGMYSIKDYTPNKGTKADWDATFTTLLAATWRGLAACADENQAALKAAVTEIQNAMNKGHSTFR